MTFKRCIEGLLGIGIVCVLAADVGNAAQTRGLSVKLRASEAADAASAGSVALYDASYALVIGIDGYTNGWPRLSNAVEDARVVAAEMEKHGFSVTLKTDPTSEELIRTLREFFIVKGEDENARLVVWFAGHGHTLDGEGFLVPADAPRPKNARQFKLTALPMRRFGEYVRLAESKHVFAVFDSCFAGTVFDAQRSLPPAAITRATTLPVRQFLTSGDADQTVSDDGTFRDLFIRALRGEERADANGDGYVTASELGLFLTDRVTNLTRGRQTPRYGKLRDKDWDRGDFVFASTGARTAAQTPAPSVPAPKPSGGVSPDMLAWSAIQASGKPIDFQTFLAAFPNSPMAPFAKARLESLSKTQAAALTPGPTGPSKDDVRAAQRLLNGLGYGAGTPDGLMGRKTREAIEAFQRDKGLSVTGEVSDALLASLREPPAVKPRPPEKGSVSSRDPRDEFRGSGRYWTVDDSGGGDFRSIQAAIDKANSGDTIGIAPGTYKESLKLDKELYLEGTGYDRSQVVIEAHDADCVLFKGPKASVRNMTLRYVGGGKFFCLDIGKGRLLVADSDLTSNGLAAIAVEGEATAPVIIGNRIHDAKQSGLFIRGKAKGLVQDNDIYGNGFAGMEVKDGANPRIIGNRFYDGKQSGVLVQEGGTGRYESNDIYANTFAGITVRKGGDPVMVGNRVHDNKQTGFFIWGGATKGRFEDNDIYGNGFAGGEVKDGANPVFVRNQFRDGKQGGIYIHANGRGRFENNDILRNSVAGVEVKKGGDPVIVGNRINDGKKSGVFVHDNGRGLFEDNEIIGNGLTGVEVKDKASPTFRNCRISRNARPGDLGT